MNHSQFRLANAARAAMFQRARLARRAQAARTALTPAALTARGKRKVDAAVDQAIAATETKIKRYRVPLGLAAIAGLGWALRRPISGLVDRLRSLQDTETQTEADPPPPELEPDDD